MAGSRTRKVKTKTDPELTRQLDEAHGTHRSVEAVVMLRPTGKATSVPADKTQEVASSAIARAEQEVGSSPTSVNVLSNLGMVMVVGEEQFVRKLLEQPEIASAVANTSTEKLSDS